MNTIFLNGERVDTKPGTALNDALTQWQAGGEFAIAINEAFIPRSLYNTVTLQAGDKVELLAPMQGG